MNHAIEQAGATADRVREELLRTLEELDRRRVQVTDWRTQLRDHRTWVIGAAGILAFGFGLNIGLVVWANRRHQKRLPERRRRALRRGWRHPERVARGSERLPIQIARAVLVASATRVASMIVGRVARQIVR